MENLDIFLPVFWRLKYSSQSQQNQTQLLFAKCLTHTNFSWVWSLVESGVPLRKCGYQKCYKIWHLAILSQWRHVVTLSSHSWQLFLLDLWPWGETEFPCPPQSEQTNEPDALFIIEKAKPRTKAEVGVKNTETFQMQRERSSFLPFLFILHVNLELVPSIILAG